MKSNRLISLLILAAAGVLILGLTWAGVAAMSAARATAAQLGARSEAAPSDVVTFNPVADAYVYSANPTQNYGSVTPLYIGNQTPSAIDRALFRFDLSTLPPGAIIDNATLRVYMSQASSGSPLVVDIGAYRITSSWTETGVVWGNQPPVLSIDKVTGVSMTLQTYEWEVTGLAQDWLANPAANFGVALRSEIEGTVGWRGFASREAAAASRPQLVIEHHLPSCTDAQEPNDTFAQAFLITPSVEYTGCIPTPSDLDYFRFDVSPNIDIRVELYSLPANYDLYLYTPDQSLLDSSVNAGTTSEMVTHTTGPTGGQFYAQVQSGGEWDFDNPYALKLTLTPVTLWPDLVVNDVWSEGSQVCYEIENIGQATAPQGHYTSLTVDDVLSATHIVTDDLAPGAKTEGCFEYQWHCTASQDEITVCADHGADVAESNEDNNCTEEIWTCDTTPPIITSGPTVSSVTSISATVSWTTDEASDSTVRFGRKAGMFTDEETSSKLTQAHVVVLTGLRPSATYHYVVRSADAASNAVASREAFFTTGPASASQSPSILGVTLTRMPGKPIYYTIVATVPISANVTQMEFEMDGERLGTAFAPKLGAIPGLYEFPLIPAALNIPREDFFTDHIVEAVAVGSGGQTGRFPVQFNPPYVCADIHVEMDYPFPDYTLYFDNGALPPDTIVPIEVYAWGTEYTHCSFIVDPQKRFACEIEAQSIERIDFAVRGTQVCTFSGHTWPQDAYTCDWDASDLGAGIYGIRVDVIASETCSQTLFRDVTVAQGEPSLRVTREVTRHGNYFEVALTVVNRGHASYDVNWIEDNVTSFQPIVKSADPAPGQHYEVTVDCGTTGESCDVKLQVSSDVHGAAIRLERGDSLTLSYLAVPILLPDTIFVPAPDYAIGGEPLRVVGFREANNPTFDRPCIVTTDGELLADAVYSATVESDYLIVTRPERLFDLYDYDETNALLSTMAELAQRKNGILGYLVGRFNVLPEVVKVTIMDWGADMRGSDDRAGNWSSNGYLLIVGETEIVPSYSVLDADIWEATTHWKSGPVFPVRLVDNYYANTDDNLEPELIVGRIIGNDPASLGIPIEMGRLDAFDCSSALVVSGLDTDTVKLESFIANANAISATLMTPFAGRVDVEHWSDYETITDALDTFTDAVQGRDAIVYSDHGGRRNWSSVFDTGDFPLDFLGSHPLVAAFACNTGYYQGINSIADKFLDSQAGGYIGSTELASRPATLEIGLMFVDRWPAGEISAGKALRNTKRALMAGDQSDYERLWVMEFNLYGDPKYGAGVGMCPVPDAAVAASDVQAAAVPTSSLEISIPDYQVTSSNGLDTARIPGGLMLLEPGLPMVPIYVVTQDYPKGYRVQDVALAARSGMVTATGLNLPLVGDDPTGVGENDLAQSTHSAPGWYPEKDFAWEIDEHADESTTLIVRMYPFYYDAATTDVQFYKNYSFDIRYISSTIEISGLATDKQIYQQDEPVTVGMVISGTDSAQDVIVETVIRRYGSSDLVDGLLLRSLTGIQGMATFFTQWDSTERGLYYAEVTLRDEAGDVLDEKTVQFTKGIASGEITTLTVSPGPFEIGEQVAVSLTFANTGTVPLTGTAVVQIQDQVAGLVEEFSHDYGNLPPGNSVNFADVWDTSGATIGSYRVVAYVLYESTATEPRVASVRMGHYLYLPLVLKQSFGSDDTKEVEK